jgi:hypothetical protein
MPQDIFELAGGIVASLSNEGGSPRPGLITELYLSSNHSQKVFSVQGRSMNKARSELLPITARTVAQWLRSPSLEAIAPNCGNLRLGHLTLRRQYIPAPYTHRLT